MANEKLTPEEARHAFRERLRQLCLEHYEVTTAGSVGTDAAAQIVAEECMHMSAYFVTRGSTFDANAFVAECRKIYDWHKSLANAAANVGKPKPSDLN